MLSPDYVENYQQQHDPLDTILGIGVILLVNELTLGPDKVFVAEQKQSKATTGKKKGEISLIQETIQGDVLDGRIVPEAQGETLRRAMGEVINDDIIQKSGADFHRVIFDRSIIVPLPSLPIRDALGRLEVVIYTGNDTNFIPDAFDEVYPARRESIASVLSNPLVRTSSKEFLTHAISHEVIPKSRSLFKQGEVEQVFPKGFSFREANRTWDKTTEMPLLLTIE